MKMKEVKPVCEQKNGTAAAAGWSEAGLDRNEKWENETLSGDQIRQ